MRMRDVKLKKVSQMVEDKDDVQLIRTSFFWREEGTSLRKIGRYP